MTKQTAVEYMYSIMFEKKGRISKEEFEKANAMFEEQIKDAYSVGYSNGQVDSNRTTEQYYNETFKSE